MHEKHNHEDEIDEDNEDNEDFRRNKCKTKVKHLI